MYNHNIYNNVTVTLTRQHTQNQIKMNKFVSMTDI